MSALKFRDLKEFNLSFPPKAPDFPNVWQTGISLLVYKTSPTFPLAKIKLQTMLRAEDCSICQMEENKIGWIKQDMCRKVSGSSLK